MPVLRKRWSLWSKRAIIAPNNLIDSEHYKRHKKIRMTEFHSPSLSILIITQSKVSFLIILNYSKMIPRLVESFRKPPPISFKHEQTGTFKCARSRCNTCPFILNTSKISGSKRSVKITDCFSCTSANVIYCITCALCNKLYIWRDR